MASEKILSSAQQLRVAMIAAAITGLIGVCVTSANYIYRCYGELRDLEAEVSTESRRVDLVLNRALEQVATSKETQERVEKRNAGIFDDINSLTTSKLSTTVCYQKQLEIAQDEAQYEIEVLSSNDLAAGLMAATRRLIESERSVWQIACNLDHTHQRERDNQLRTALITLKSSSETVAAANKRLQYELDLYAAEQHGHLRTMSNKLTEMKWANVFAHIGFILSSFLLYKLINHAWFQKNLREPESVQQLGEVTQTIKVESTASAESDKDY